MIGDVEDRSKGPTERSLFYFIDFRYSPEFSILDQKIGGGDVIRTRVRAFAERCLATWLRHPIQMYRIVSHQAQKCQRSLSVS